MKSTQEHEGNVEWRLGELAQVVGVSARGDQSKIVRRISTLQEATSDSIAYYCDQRFRKYLDDTRAGVVILSEADAQGYPGACLIAPNPRAAFAKVAGQLYPSEMPAAGIHPSAVVAEDATVSKTAAVQPGAVIESKATIGDGAVIGPGAVVGVAAIIGENSRLDGNVTIYEGSTIGKNCIIKANAVIGAPGFSFVWEDGRWVQIPNFGKVIIGDDVSVGASTSIDRGTINATVVGNGVKIDNNVQIAHNVEIGEHTIIAGNVGIAGSARIGKRCMFGGQAGVLDHVEICDDVVVNAGSLVTKSINVPGKYSATIPAQPAGQWRKTFASLRQLGRKKTK